MKSKIQKIFSNHKIRIFLFFLAISAGSLVLNKLSKEYKTTLQFEVYADKIPVDKILLKQPETMVRIFVKASGFNLIGYKIRSKKIKINASNATFVEGTTYKIETNRLIGEFQEQLSADTEIVELIDKTILIEMGRIISKKIPVHLKSTITYEKGYKMKGFVVLEPDSISIVGAEDKIANINFVSTKPLILNNVYSNFDEEIGLLITDELNEITISDEKVNVSAQIEKFTELSFLVPIKIINNFNNYQIETFPSKVKLFFQVELSTINKINSDQFIVVCDLDNTLENKLNYLIPKVIEKPSSVLNYHIEPSKIDFIIRKK